MLYVYPHLHDIAAGYLRYESAGHTLQPTALVHELYLRLLHQRKAEWNDRAHFYTFAAKMMRLIPADHARGGHAAKRGGGAASLQRNGESPWIDLYPVHVVERDIAQYD